MTTLRAHGLPFRLIRFFNDNPCEELTIRQIATKFESSESRVRSVLCTLAKIGVIESVCVVRLPSMGRSQEAA